MHLPQLLHKVEFEAIRILNTPHELSLVRALHILHYLIPYGAIAGPAHAQVTNFALQSGPDTWTGRELDWHLQPRDVLCSRDDFEIRHAGEDLLHDQSHLNPRNRLARAVVSA